MCSKQDEKSKFGPLVASDKEETQNQMGWPEEDSRASFLVLIWRRLTFSYMGLILKKGAKQTLDNGTHLRQNDLYSIPKKVRSATLHSKFQ